MSEKNNKILIDACFVNHGGGRTLLNYLIDKFEGTSLNITYLLDYRIKNNHSKISKSNKVIFIKNSIVHRHFFLLKEKNSYDKVLCFGNVPPTTKIKATVYTYFHQLLYLENTFSNGVFSGLSRKLKIFIISIFSGNTDYWLVQTENVKTLLLNRIKTKTNNILCMPFYFLKEPRKSNRKFNRFNKLLYVSATDDKYKNHEILIDGFILAYEKLKDIQLHLTLDSPRPEIKSRLDFCLNKGIPVINHGLVNEEKLNELYFGSEYVIFPSLTESFGLPIIEGINYGCKIIASDRKYVDQICIPSLKFNPLDKYDIAEKIIKTNEMDVPKSKLLVKDEADKILDLLSFAA